MFSEEYDIASHSALNKVTLLKKNMPGYLTSSALAGIFVGFGMIFIYMIAGYMEGLPCIKIVQGLSFPVALSLVVMAGADLFTGNNFVMVAGVIKKRIKPADALNLWVVCYIGNFIGSILIAAIFVGTGFVTGPIADAIQAGVVAKTNVTAMNLFMKGVMCNLLVCSAVWCSYKLKSESGKSIMIFWCIYTFIACGFEHSIANMTLFAIGVFADTMENVTMAMMANNLLFVTLGNIVGGAGLSLAYGLISRKNK